MVATVIKAIPILVIITLGSFPGFIMSISVEREDPHARTGNPQDDAYLAVEILTTMKTLFDAEILVYRELADDALV